MRGVTVSNSFSVGEEGAKHLTHFKMEHDNAVSWQQELGSVSFQPRSGSPGEGEQRTGPTPYSPGLPYAPDSIGCPNITKQWPRKQSTQWLYLYHRAEHAAPYLAHKSLSREHPAPVLLPAHPLPGACQVWHFSVTFFGAFKDCIATTERATPGLEKNARWLPWLCSTDSEVFLFAAEENQPAV